MTDLQMEALNTKTDNRRSLMEVLEFLVNRGASTETIRLAMVRAGITTEVAHVLSQCVVAPETVAAPENASATTAPSSAVPARAYGASSRAAGLALQKLLGLIVMVGLIYGVGILLGFSAGMELGRAQGLQSIEAGLDRIARVVRVTRLF